MADNTRNHVARAILAAAGLDESKVTKLVLISTADGVEKLHVTYYTNGFNEPPTLLKLKVEPL